MLSLTYSPPIFIRRLEPIKVSGSKRSVVVCAAKGPRPRYPRVWKTKNRIGTVSKSAKFVDCIMKLSNVKEEVYGALDAFVAWELEFPLITVKKALKTLEEQREWKRIIQVTKWMLSKGQGRTMGSYFTLLNALAEDGRLDEAELLWTKLFTQNLASTPRVFYDKMISIYYKRGMHEKMFEIFADMEELGVKPNVGIVSMVGNVFKELGMMDKYNKLNKKYPPPKWEYRYIKGKRVKVRSKHPEEPDGSDGSDGHASKQEKTKQTSKTMDEECQTSSDELDMEAACSSKDVIEHEETGHSNEFHEEAETSSNEVHIEADYSSKDVSMPEETARTSNEFHEEAEPSSNEVHIKANYSSKDVSMPEETARTSNEFHEEAETSSNEVHIEANYSSKDVSMPEETART